MDTISSEKRSWNMAQIHSKDTKPEEAVRKFLFSKGLRYRKNDKHLPGKPDIVLPKYKTAVFINGCFWHGHNECKRYRLPKSNIDYWSKKIEGNINRDKKNYEALESLGWNIVIIWECELKKGTFNEQMMNLYVKIKGNEKV